MQKQQGRDAIEVADILRHDSVAELHGARSNDKIGQRESNSLGRLLSADPGDDLSGCLGHWMDRYMSFQLVKKPAALACPLHRVGAIDPVAKLTSRASSASVK